MISREIIKREYQLEVEKCISEARHFQKGEYRYTDVWDMEPCHEYTRRKRHKKNIKYHGDEEWSYMFSRMGFLYVYAIASVFDNQSYISQANNLIVEILTDTTNKSALKKILNRFFKHDLLQRSLDKSIRIVNILDYIDICKSNKLEVYFHDYLKWLSKLWDEIFWDDSLKKEKSNWGIIETASLLYSATYLNKDKYVKELKDRLLRQLKNQIEEDGSHSESAPMYLVQIELSLLKYLKENDCAEIEFYAKKIADYLLEITDPLGNILNIGDTDVSNMSDVFIIASQILNDYKYYQKVTRKPLLLYVYKYDLMIGESLECTDVIRPCQNNVVDLNGITVIRKNDLYLACCNTISDSGHKHCDNASIILMKNKLPILVDCGCYTYKNCSERKYFVSPQCHNTISIREKFVYENSWKYNAGIVYAENNLLIEIPKPPAMLGRTE